MYFNTSFITCVRKIAKSDYYLSHVCLSVRMEQLGSHRTDLHDIFGRFPKTCRGNSRFVKIWREWRLLYMKTLMTMSLFILLRIINVSYKSDMKNPNTHFMFYNFFFLKRIVLFWRQCRKLWWSQRGHRWQYNTTHAFHTLGDKGYRHTHTHTLRIRNSYCFSTATMVMQKCLSCTFIVPFLSCFF
jgi:hypothetical protein